MKTSPSVSVRLALGLALALAAGAVTSRSEEVAVGVARVDVSPSGPIRLHGYLVRTTESTAVGHPIFAKALAIGSDEQKPVVLVSVDSLGVSAAIIDEVAARLEKKAGLPRERLALGASHTHSAPLLTGVAPNIFGKPIPPDQQARIDAYTREFTDKLERVCLDALADRKPAKLSWAQGKVGFAANRRTPGGPVDHSLPALKVESPDGQVRAVVTNYACHCTSAGSENRVGPDWAGFAAEEIERDAPGATAVITIGCGADVGPQPTGNVGLSRRHGRALADAVAAVAKGPNVPLSAGPEVVQATIELPLASVPGREHWEKEAKREGFEGRHARRMLAQLDRDGKLPAAVPYPIAAWRFGGDLAIVFLPGEVTVDYAVRLKGEMDWTRLWINGWSNDVPGYIPSKRVLAEGGYEPDFSQIYYGWPTHYSPDVEDLLVSTVESLLGDGFRKTADTPAPDFFAVPEALLPSMRK